MLHFTDLACLLLGQTRKSIQALSKHNSLPGVKKESSELKPSLSRKFTKGKKNASGDLPNGGTNILPYKSNNKTEVSVRCVL